MKYLGFALILFSGCVPPAVAPSPKASEAPIAVETETPVSTPTPKMSPTKLPVPVLDIVAASPCTSRYWKDRGKAPLGYVRGVAQVFSNAVCANTPVIPLGSSSKDALAYLDKPATRVNTYTLLLGLGMRESSGNYGEGWDTSAKTHTETGAEAGLFQASFDSSFDSIVASSSLRSLFDKYRSNQGAENSPGCIRDVFSQGAHGSHQSIIGVGKGAEFQTFTKQCPAFATEYAAILVRILRQYAGPINRKEVEFVPACQQMFQDIQDKAPCP